MVAQIVVVEIQQLLEQVFQLQQVVEVFLQLELQIVLQIVAHKVMLVVQVLEEIQQV
jgi:hypothetical protein